MQASKHTVDEVLEAIADCILQCVLFSTEADEAGAKVQPTKSPSPSFSLQKTKFAFSPQLKSLNTDGLTAAMRFLSELGPPPPTLLLLAFLLVCVRFLTRLHHPLHNSATKKAAMWGEYDQKMEQEMLSSARV